MHNVRTFISVSLSRTLALAITLLACAVAMCNSAHGQLQITELMIEPGDGNVWEWIEVRNTGGTVIDLDGYILDRLGDSPLAPDADPNVDASVATNTAIRAGGVAVLYDAQIADGNPGNFNDQVFRNAWGLSSGVPIIGVQNFPALTNSGTAVGLWANRDDYDDDVADLGDGDEVASFAHAAVGIDFRMGMGFPEDDGIASIYWDGTGSFQSGGNWELSDEGVDGAVESVPVSLAGAQSNSTSDVGNPGIAPGGTPLAGLLVTEIMYNPLSTEPDWGHWLVSCVL